MDNNVVWKLLSVWVVQYALTLAVVDNSRTTGLSGVCVNPHMRVKLKVFTIILNQNQIATYETVCVRCVCVNVIRAHSHSFHLPKKKFLMNVIILLLKQNKSALVCVCASSRRTETLNKLNLIYVVPNFLVL